jgi:hypothetical protein
MYPFRRIGRSGTESTCISRLQGGCPIGLLQVLSLGDSLRFGDHRSCGPLSETVLGPGLSRPTTRSARTAQWFSLAEDGPTGSVRSARAARWRAVPRAQTRERSQNGDPKGDHGWRGTAAADASCAATARAGWTRSSDGVDTLNRWLDTLKRRLPGCAPSQNASCHRLAECSRLAEYSPQRARC